MGDTILYVIAAATVSNLIVTVVLWWRTAKRNRQFHDSIRRDIHERASLKVTRGKTYEERLKEEYAKRGMVWEDHR